MEYIATCTVFKHRMAIMTSELLRVVIFMQILYNYALCCVDKHWTLLEFVNSLDVLTQTRVIISNPSADGIWPCITRLTISR